MTSFCRAIAEGQVPDSALLYPESCDKVTGRHGPFLAISISQCEFGSPLQSAYLKSTFLNAPTVGPLSLQHFAVTASLYLSRPV